MEILSLAALPFIALYLLPSWIGLSGRHPSLPKIFRLNLLLGWTVIGWIIALAWCLVHVKKQESLA